MITRRTWIKSVGAGSLAAAALPACESDSPGMTTTPDSSMMSMPDAAGGDTCGPAAAAWASGGTAAMTAKTCYPDPFASSITSCPLVVCATTAGPCTATSPAREDVSEGRTGLPVRLALKLIAAGTCAPIANASVDIWHTQVSGVYSGQTPAPGFCSGGDADAPNHSYFRGTQVSDASGRVSFDTCFPGWYPGRAIHIHFRITVGGTVSIVSQLFFSDALATEIFAGHADYKAFGPPDTRNTSDGVIGGAANFNSYVLDTVRMSDGAMLASKVIAIRGAAQTNCTA